MVTTHAIDLLNEETLLATRRFPRSGTSPTDLRTRLSMRVKAHSQCLLGN